MTQTVYTVLLYSDRPEIRERMRTAVGTRPAPDLTVEFVEAATYDECVSLVDEYRIDRCCSTARRSQPAGSE